MHMGNNNPGCIYQMGDTKLQERDQEKDLGVYICNNCKSSVQCAKSAQKAMNSLRVIKRTFKHITKDSFAVLYKTYIRLHLEYCVQAWNPGLRKDIHTLEKVQRRATKLVPAVRHLSYPDMLEALDLYSLEQRRTRGDLIEVFKIFNGFDKTEPTRFFKISNTRETRGHNMKIFKSGMNKALRCRQDFFSQRVVNTWNDLPSYVVNAKTTNSFKHELDEYWKRYGVIKAYKA
ncbi:uncharacterized protein LOC119735252 [Patiria miniata]|uniref:Uncharacterized protein n=1 Tax=Patiria miniata TaxID=46514 RepID=A0A914ALK4_PATMI|nr:uncharacterized protein LOC119735252 [Patiria miniata]